MKFLAFSILGSKLELPKISLKKFDAYQRALIYGTDFDDE
jgi:hypothetical protein